MRTTVDIDGPILQQLKKIAAKEEKTLGRVISDLLVTALARSRAPTAAAWKWPTFDMGAPLIDLDDRDAVNLALDREKLDASK